MNILVLAKDTKGIHTNKVIERHIHHWADNGHNVTYFSTEDSAAIEKKNIRVKTANLASFASVAVDLVIKRGAYDIIIEKTDKLPFFLPLATKSKKIMWAFSKPEVISCTGQKGINKTACALLKQIFEGLIYKVLYREVDWVASSHYLKDELVGFGVKKESVEVLETGTSIEKIKENKVETISLVTQDESSANLTNLVTLASLINRKKSCRYLLVGNFGKKEKEVVVREAKRLEIAKRVKVVSINDVKDALKRSDAVVFDKSYSSGRDIVEAASWGNIIFAYDNKSTNEYLKKNPGVVTLEEENPISVSEKVLNAIGKDGKYIKLRTNTQKWVEKYSWDKILKSGLKLIESV